MSDTLVTYELQDGVATLTLDDGKRNALSPAMLEAIEAALDRAEADQAMVILTGRDTVLSAGFDLKVMKSGGPQTLKMLRLGYLLSARVLEYPYPVIAACNGHVLAMGVFLMLACDYVIGTRGDFKVSANEVALGLTIPRVGAAMLGHRLTPAAYQRAVNLSEFFDVDSALQAGFFDQLVDSHELMPTARALASQFASLDMRAHAATKRRIRHDLIKGIRRQVKLDLADAVLLGLRGRQKR
ncbi:crotonase/enoyl-CoA hydratase family protein [Abyssibacter profundi]|uniref:Crotonase/enoyl-CoA hydratase family protein n=1 Tax=Abyssibacter profundi TaxID=2182787 RepID=A0A363UMK9_9GAMM|nr:crotonase/enoyl-CoA hydratase family protein [Abyssibacter profundi]PWN56659.1 crotonase/enoyl-CoA hydratase family protein [Abyssibacter profundi]